MSQPTRRAEKAEQLAHKLKVNYEQLVAVRFAFNVALGTFICWIVLRHVLHDNNPVWAIASMVSSADPDPKEAKKMLKGRLINVLVGCAVAVLFMLIGGAREWLLPMAMFVCVAVTSLFVRIKTMWRQAPVTTAFVISAGVLHESAREALDLGLHRVAEVVFGCLVGVLISILMSKLWIIRKYNVELPSP
jgi:uncharacterized membrane protein YgaE (UPF0421/DUF939 family)